MFGGTFFGKHMYIFPSFQKTVETYTKLTINLHQTDSVSFDALLL